MEKLTITREIQLVCVRATSFPDGILAAYKKLEQMVTVKDRTVYGISHGSDSGILYWACAEAKSKTEAAELGLESYTIRKGVYATETVNNIQHDEEVIGKTFNKLLEHPELDETGKCIEWYKSLNEVTCMVRIVE